MQHFNATFHHGGEFVMVNQNEIIYKGGVDSNMSGLHIENWTIDSVHKMVNRWGYKKGSYRLWTKFLEIDESFIQIRKDDDAYDFGSYCCAMVTDGDIFVEYDVKNMELGVREPKCVNRVTDMEGIEDEVVEGLDDREDDIATALVDGFEGIDVTLPIREYGVITGLLGSPNKKFDEDDYYSDELDSSYPDDSCDDKMPKYERFRK
ncbi:unnamed protein product [Lathyrus sativus]|nr:unnamed protein product [Lathyrus sativus]